MMTRDMIEHWRELIKASGRDLGPLSKALGKDRSYLSGVLAGRTSDPGVFTSMKLASELGISFETLMRRDDTLSLTPDPNYQLEVNKQASRVLSDVMRVARQKLYFADEFSKGAFSDSFVPLLLRWWHQQGGLLIGHEQLQEHFDIIRCPAITDRMVEPYEVGGKSLAARKLGTTSPDALRKLVETFDDTTRLDLVQSYYEVSTTGEPSLSSPIRVSIPLPEEVSPIEVEYFRLQLPVASPRGDKFVLSYCFPA